MNVKISKAGKHYVIVRVKTWDELTVDDKADIYSYLAKMKEDVARKRQSEPKTSEVICG